MGYPIRLNYEPLKEKDATTLTANYLAVGTSLTHPVRMVRIQNTGDKDVRISFDGINDFTYMSAGTSLLLDITANQTREEGFYLPKGITVYAKHNGVVPTSGDIFITTIYGVNT